LKKLLSLISALLVVSCHSRPLVNNRSGNGELVVAAAANLSNVFIDIGAAFTRETGVRVVFSFGATADLTHQIQNGAPFDVFASADTAHVEQLEKEGLLTPGSLARYARGRLVLWLPPGSNLNISRVEDITAKSFERIAIAKPDVAPYGAATIESLRGLGIWNVIQSRVVYAQNVSQAKQYAATGNAEVAFLPLSLVNAGEGSYIEVDEHLHAPIDQAMGIVKDSAKQEAAQRFRDFVLSQEGQDMLRTRGYNGGISQ
jgi:molybdate transport system substrate-binding protein